MLGRLAVKYKRLPIMLLYNVKSTDSPDGLFVNFAFATIGVLTWAALSSQNLLTRLLAYFAWLCRFLSPFASPAILKNKLVHQPYSFLTCLHFICKRISKRIISNTKNNIININLSYNKTILIISYEESSIYRFLFESMLNEIYSQSII